MQLYKANRQWAERPADERATDLNDLYQKTRHYFESAIISSVSLSQLDVTAEGEELYLHGLRSKLDARFTHWAFGQFCQRVQAPADHYRSLPATLAQPALSYLLRKASAESNRNAQLLFHKNGDFVLRAMNGNQYARIWNYEVAERLMPLGEYGWRVPPARPASLGQPGSRPATEADVLAASQSGLSVNIGDLIAPAGLYVSDHDMFAFMVNENFRINDGTDQGMSRGFFVENSEVGDGAFVLTTFLYRHVCGNHIVWGAKNVKEIRIRHVGQAPEKAFGQIEVAVNKYANESASDLEAQIVKAKHAVIGNTKDEVLDELFRALRGDITKNLIEEAYDKAVQEETINQAAPNTQWGITQGLTSVAKEMAFGDKRVKVDRAAGKVMSIEF